MRTYMPSPNEIGHDQASAPRTERHVRCRSAGLSRVWSREPLRPRPGTNIAGSMRSEITAQREPGTTAPVAGAEERGVAAAGAPSVAAVAGAADGAPPLPVAATARP